MLATSQIYILSLHDALPILLSKFLSLPCPRMFMYGEQNSSLSYLPALAANGVDRKSTRLNSSHRCISYAVFCLKKKITSIAVHPPQTQSSIYTNLSSLAFLI